MSKVCIWCKARKKIGPKGGFVPCAGCIKDNVYPLEYYKKHWKSITDYSIYFVVTRLDDNSIRVDHKLMKDYV